MNKADRSSYIEYRIESVHKALASARLLAENSMWEACTNRLYYAVFYAVNALLVKNEIKASTHSGLKTQFSLRFVKTGLLPKNFGVLLSRVFDLRNEGDYGNLFTIEEEEIVNLFPEVEQMIDRIIIEIRKS
ncbi:MAG: HEPN domain-containing protein [Cyclobacteriaceae bacterium]